MAKGRILQITGATEGWIVTFKDSRQRASVAAWALIEYGGVQPLIAHEGAMVPAPEVEGYEGVVFDSTMVVAPDWLQHLHEEQDKPKPQLKPDGKKK
jgi:hypothetical protein